jgi:hypothetical protein
MPNWSVTLIASDGVGFSPQASHIQTSSTGYADLSIITDSALSDRNLNAGSIERFLQDSASMILTRLTISSSVISVLPPLGRTFVNALAPVFRDPYDYKIVLSASFSPIPMPCLQVWNIGTTGAIPFNVGLLNQMDSVLSRSFKALLMYKAISNIPDTAAKFDADANLVVRNTNAIDLRDTLALCASKSQSVIHMRLGDDFTAYGVNSSFRAALFHYIMPGSLVLGSVNPQQFSDPTITSPSIGIETLLSYSFALASVRVLSEAVPGEKKWTQFCDIGAQGFRGAYVARAFGINNYTCFDPAFAPYQVQAAPGKTFDLQRVVAPQIWADEMTEPTLVYASFVVQNKDQDTMVTFLKAFIDALPPGSAIVFNYYKKQPAGSSALPLAGTYINFSDWTDDVWPVPAKGTFKGYEPVELIDAPDGFDSFDIQLSDIMMASVRAGVSMASAGVHTAAWNEFLGCGIHIVPAPPVNP